MTGMPGKKNIDEKQTLSKKQFFLPLLFRRYCSLIFKGTRLSNLQG